MSTGTGGGTPVGATGPYGTVDAAAPGPRRQARGVQRRKAIIDGAAALFDSSGFAKTSMADLAIHVGVAKPTLYHYFASKEEILYAIHGEFIDLLLEKHDTRVRAGGSRPTELLLAIMQDIFGLMETHRGHVRVFFEHHRELSGAARTAMKAKRDSYESAVVDLVRAAISVGDMRPVDSRLVTLAIFGMCNWGYQWYRPGGGASADEVARMFWDFLLHGLKSPDGRVSSDIAAQSATAPPRNILLATGDCA